MLYNGTRIAVALLMPLLLRFNYEAVALSLGYLGRCVDDGVNVAVVANAYVVLTLRHLAVAFDFSLRFVRYDRHV